MLSPQQLARIEEVFLEAIGVDAKQWPRLLAERCGEDSAVRAEVESLLASHGQGADLLATLNAPGRGLLDDFGAEPLRLEEPSLPADRTIGSYTVLGILGAGGMGVVYLAEQNSPRRTVALKLLRRMDPTEAHLRRFEFESEVLGRLQHPGIAQIYEAGTAKTPEGVRPFIAMELVRGKPLTDHCQAAALGTAERLELVAKVADAVHHAHLRGVIHRDLKPGNIFVTDGAATAGDTRSSHDGVGHEPVPKILDFGIARVADDAAVSMHTRADQLLGTLAYMSPEQVEGDRREIDARSDVYSLGVILYELMAGKLPHNPAGRSLAEMARVIRDDEPTRLGEIDRSLRGDIEAIVTRAMAKDPARRHQSAADLAEDLRRCNLGLPILSRHDSAMYVLRKQMWRYRWVVGGVAAFVVGLSVTGVIAMVQAAKAEESAADARRATGQAEANLKVAQEERKAAMDARAAADKSAAELAEQLAASNIERGRLQANARSLRLAEDLIWPEYLRNPASLHAHWALWETYDRNPCVAVLKATPRGIRGMACSPSGRLAAVCDGTTLTVLDATDGRVLSSRDFGVALAGGVEFLDEQTVVVSGTMGATALVRAPWTELSDQLELGPSASVAMASNALGYVVRADDEGVVTLWRPGEAKPVTLLRLGRRARGASLSADGMKLAVITEPGDLFVIDTRRGEWVERLAVPGVGQYDVALSPDGTRMVVSSVDRMVRVMDMSGNVLAEISSDATPVSDVEWLADGSGFVVVGWFSVDVWSADGRTKRRSFVAHAVDTSRTAISPDGRRILTGDNEGIVRLWETSSGNAMRKLRPTSGRLLESCWTPDARSVIAGGADPVVVEVDRETGRVVQRFEGLTSEVQTVAASADGTLVAAADKNGFLVIWDRASGKARARIRSPLQERITNTFHAVKFLPDNSVIAGSVDRAIRIYETDGTLRKQVGRIGNVPGTIDISRDGSLVAVAPDRSGVHLFNLATGEDLGEAVTKARPWVATFSPDGRTLAVGTWEGSIGLVDVATRRERAVLRGQDRLIAAVSFAPDGKLLAAAGYDGTIKLYDPIGERVLVTLLGHTGVARGVVFSPDGRSLASTGDDGLLGLWDLGYYDRHIAGNRAAAEARERADGRRGR